MSQNLRPGLVVAETPKSTKFTSSLDSLVAQWSLPPFASTPADRLSSCHRPSLPQISQILLIQFSSSLTALSYSCTSEAPHPPEVDLLSSQLELDDLCASNPDPRAQAFLSSLGPGSSSRSLWGKLSSTSSSSHIPEDTNWSSYPKHPNHTVKMNGDTDTKRDIKNHLLFEIATEVANRGITRSPDGREGTC